MRESASSPRPRSRNGSNTAGVLDAGFGTGGIVHTNFSSASGEGIFDMKTPATPATAQEPVSGSLLSALSPELKAGYSGSIQTGIATTYGPNR